MAAISKTWADGDAFTAADANTYFMRQTIIACDNQTDRDSILTPQEGLTVYRKDLNTLETYNGSAWETNISTKTAVGTFASPASTGNLAVTGLGFKPKMVKFTVGLTSATSSFMVMGGGAMTSTSQYAYAWGARNSLNGRHTRAASTTQCLALLNISAGDVVSDGYVAQYVSMDSGGFTVNFTTTATGATIYWEAIG